MINVNNGQSNIMLALLKLLCGSELRQDCIFLYEHRGVLLAFLHENQMCEETNNGTCISAHFFYD